MRERYHLLFYNAKLSEIERPAYNWFHVLWRKCFTCLAHFFFHWRTWCSFSPYIWWPLAFLIFSSPLQNFHIVLLRKQVSLLSFISPSPPLPLSISLVEFHCVFSVPSHEIFPGIFSGNRRFSLPFLDLDECVQGSHDCLQNLASCSNTDGSYKCSCNDGYIGDGKTYCQPKGKDVFIISMSGFISLQARESGNHQGIAECKLQRLKWADFDNDDGDIW